MNNGNAKISTNLNSYSISIPSKKNWFALVFGIVWLGGWFIGFMSVFEELFYNTNPVNSNNFDSFMLIWLVAWTLGVFFVVFMLSWGFFGKETFILDSKNVVFEKTILGLGLKKKLEKKEVTNFRFEKVNESIFIRNNWAVWGLGPGKIKFDYGLKTYSFALGVDDAEANYLIKELNHKFSA